MFAFGLQGVSQGQKILSEGLVRLCGSCGSHGRYQVIMTYMYFSFFFIPLFKWNRRYYVKMDCCEAVYELDPVVGKAVLRGENPASGAGGTVRQNLAGGL